MMDFLQKSWIIFISYVFAEIGNKTRTLPFADALRTGKSNRRQQTEKKLYKELLGEYNKELRPVLHPDEAVNVNVSIVLTNVIDINEKHQSLTTLLWMMTEWYDPFLSWNETEHPGINYFVVLG